MLRLTLRDVPFISSSGVSGVRHIQQPAAVNEREIGLSSNDILPLASCWVNSAVILFQHPHKEDTPLGAAMFKVLRFVSFVRVIFLD